MLWTKHDDMNHHFRRYTRTTFQQQAAEAGMRVDVCRYFYHWLFPVKLGIRLKESVYDVPGKEPDVPKQFINDICYRWSRLEQRMFSAVPLPVGSSLLAIGGKP